MGAAQQWAEHDGEAEGQKQECTLVSVTTLGSPLCSGYLAATRLWARGSAEVSAGVSGNSILGCTPPKRHTPQLLGENSRADESCHPLLVCNYSALLMPVPVANVMLG